MIELMVSVCIPIIVQSRTSQIHFLLIVTYARCSLAVQIGFATHVHDGVKQEIYCRLAGCKEILLQKFNHSTILWHPVSSLLTALVFIKHSCSANRHRKASPWTLWSSPRVLCTLLQMVSRHSWNCSSQTCFSFPQVS